MHVLGCTMSCHCDVHLRFCVLIRVKGSRKHACDGAMDAAVVFILDSVRHSQMGAVSTTFQASGRRRCGWCPRDDPFVAMVPIELCLANPNVALAETSRGGHVAFLEGAYLLACPRSLQSTGGKG